MSTEIRKASTTPILYNGANAVYAVKTDSALAESPRDDYSYRVFTESGTFVTNSVLCKTER